MLMGAEILNKLKLIIEGFFVQGDAKRMVNLYSGDKELIHL